MTLEENLDRLFQFVSGGPDQPPLPTSVLIAELKPEDFEGSRPRVREENLRAPKEYEARFAELLDSGFGWLNMNYCGVLRGHALIIIEYPKSSTRTKGVTSVNYSGPPKVVANAGWDALAYVRVTPMGGS